MKNIAVMAFLAAFVLAPAQTQQQAPQKRLIEIYRIQAGMHEQFLRMLAKFEEAERQAGLPERELYVHQDGAEWDFIIIKREDPSPEKMAKAYENLKKMGGPTGGRFFLEVRKYVAEHSDTFAEGPTTATDWLKKLD